MFGPELTIWPSIGSYLLIFPAGPTFRLANTLSSASAKRADHLSDEIISLTPLCHRVQPNVLPASVREKDVRFTMADIPKAPQSFQP